ncbi:hypothetical protein ACWEKM_12610 [Streptomyces sp. NPDC004752]
MALSLVAVPHVVSDGDRARALVDRPLSECGLELIEPGVEMVHK